MTARASCHSESSCSREKVLRDCLPGAVGFFLYALVHLGGSLMTFFVERFWAAHVWRDIPCFKHLVWQSRLIAVTVIESSHGLIKCISKVGQTSAHSHQNETVRNERLRVETPPKSSLEINASSAVRCWGLHDSLCLLLFETDLMLTDVNKLLFFLHAILMSCGLRPPKNDVAHKVRIHHSKSTNLIGHFGLNWGPAMGEGRLSRPTFFVGWEQK